MHLRTLRTPAASILLALLLAAKCRGLQPATPLSRFARQSWTMENGLPQNTVSVLLQSRSGFLWAGTELGLARFDGMNFRVFDHTVTPAFPDAEVRCLLDGDNGELWVGTGDGLVRWVNGNPKLLTTADGLPSNSIRGLVRTLDGAVWAWTDGGLARWNGTQFKAMGPDLAKAGAITSLAASADGDLWAGTQSGAMVFHEGQWSEMPMALGGPNARLQSRLNGAGSMVVRSDGGDVWIEGSEGLFLGHNGSVVQQSGPGTLPEDGVHFLAVLANGWVAAASKSAVVLWRKPQESSGAPAPKVVRFEVAKQLPGARIEAMYADRDGCLWVGTNNGLARIAVRDGAASVEVLPPTDPLASAGVVAFLEDREGDLWVGTETAGLHILRDARFRILGAADGLASDATTAIVEDTHGSLWIGTRDAGLNRIANGKMSTMTTANGLLSNVILALAAAPDGTVWVGTPDGLNRVSQTGVTGYTSADGLPDDFIRSVLVAPDRTVWIGTRRGLTHLDHGRFLTMTDADGLGSNLVGALAASADGDLWIATLNGLSRLHQGRLQNFTTADGLSSNVITALSTTPNGMLWIGTQSDGLNLWDGKQFRALRGNPIQSEALPKAIHALLPDDQGYLWLASDLGLTRADTQGLLNCALHATCSLKTAHFTTADGLRTRETSSNSHPTACRRSNGELWFTTPKGVILVDPLHFAPTPDSPPVAIERFAVDNKDVEAASDARITAGRLSFQFDYVGLSFAAPQKLRYQYMLQGFDHGWVDAGTRHTAYYTNLPPGKYSFRVRASFADSGEPAAYSAASQGISNDPNEAEISFELLPQFYQTVWFRALMVLLVAALIFAFFRRRVHRVEHEFRAVMSERNRIAREIHDTLAQGYVGISLQLEILGELLRHNRGDAAAKHLAATQGLVREGLEDARQSIWALRSHDAAEQALPIRLRRLVERAGDAQLSAHLEVHGAYRALVPKVEGEILRIAQEAIQNVKRHSAASRLTVRLDYDERGLVLSVSDDGKGFLTSSISTAGHYGLTGMRERAALIEAELEIESEPGQGTTVRLRVAVSDWNHPAANEESAQQQASTPKE